MFFDALPAYLGGKRKLAPLIFALLTRHLPSSDWRGLTFVDPVRRQQLSDFSALLLMDTLGVVSHSRLARL